VEPAELTFPLVPRWRPVGSPFGRLRAARRGLGTSVAGTRPYRAGDDPGAIDWKTSARLSSVRPEAEFIVRQQFADEAPRIVLVCDRRPSMALYPPPLPWLSKPAAVREVWRALRAAARRELGLAGYLDPGAWLAPRSPGSLASVERRLADGPFDAREDSLELAFRRLQRARRWLPPGTFLFVCSDFLSPPPLTCWLRALAHRWDVVPVVIQDPRFERSFPALAGLVLSIADARTGRIRKVRLGAGEVEARRRAHERRFAALLADLRSVGLDPIVISSAAPAAVGAALAGWAEARLAQRRGEW